MKQKEYTNGEITVVWKPELCYHAANCVHMLPEVYNPDARPWIKIENASSEALKQQVKTCPSGALTYFMNNKPDDSTTAKNSGVETVINGPLIVYGALEIEDEHKNIINRDTKTAFCRCGSSSNKPFCDGTHMKNEWTSED